MKNGSKIAVHKGEKKQTPPFRVAYRPVSRLSQRAHPRQQPCANIAPWGKANTAIEGNAPSSRAQHSVTSCCRAHLKALTKVSCEPLLCFPDKCFCRDGLALVVRSATKALGIRQLGKHGGRQERSLEKAEPNLQLCKASS